MRYLYGLVVGLCIVAGSARAETPDAVPPDLWRAALSATLLEPSDLSFRNDYVERDDARLQVVDWSMANPLQLPGWLRQIGAVQPIDFAPEAAEGEENQQLWRLAAPALPDTLPRLARPAADVAALFPRSLQPLLSVLALLNGDDPGGRFAAGSDGSALPDTVWRLLTHDFPELIWEDAEDEFRSPEWQDSVQQTEEEIARRLVPLTAAIPRARIWQLGHLLFQHFAAWSEAAGTTDLDRLRESSFAHDTKTELDTPFGRVALGSVGPDTYRGSYAFIFEPGGDDTYELAYSAAHPSRVLIDVRGDDSYRALTDAALAGGFWGAQILRDLDGDDVYRAKRLDLGAGMFGWGMLSDHAGDDIYEGDTFIQGAGAFGFGLLLDSAGNDTYRGALFAQGFGFVGGTGALYDHDGNDHYHAGGKYKDVLRYVDRYLSLSQGFAYGIRPFLSGGVGLLLDRAGNDDYNCDIFGQGASYWWGLGGLWDGAGNDRYLAFQYAQGSATHLTAALLVDDRGNDVYFSKGVSQGCGHDLAPGLLWDLEGDDTYTAYDLSQGAGSANGLGILFDGAGADRYYVKSLLNTQGYGNPRRDYGSIGLFLDGGGVDRYDGPGADSTWWQVDSKWGIGIDYDPGN